MVQVFLSFSDAIVTVIELKSPEAFYSALLGLSRKRRGFPRTAYPMLRAVDLLV